jgi:hypothetical protein
VDAGWVARKMREQRELSAAKLDGGSPSRMAVRAATSISSGPHTITAGPSLRLWRLLGRQVDHGDYLHAESQRPRVGELRAAISPLVRDLLRLHATSVG